MSPSDKQADWNRFLMSVVHFETLQLLKSVIYFTVPDGR